MKLKLCQALIWYQVMPPSKATSALLQATRQKPAVNKVQRREDLALSVKHQNLGTRPEQLLIEVHVSVMLPTLPSCMCAAIISTLSRDCAIILNNYAGARALKNVEGEGV